MGNLGDRLRMARKRTRLSQDKVSELTGLNKNKITRYELNYETPSREVVEKLAELYSVEVEYLISGENAPLWYVNVVDLLNVLNRSQVITYKGRTLNNNEIEKVRTALSLILE